MKRKEFWPEVCGVGNDSRALPVDAQVPRELMHGLYVMRLMEEGVSEETAMELIVDGILQPN